VEIKSRILSEASPNSVVEPLDIPHSWMVFYHKECTLLTKDAGRLLQAVIHLIVIRDNIDLNLGQGTC